MGHGMTWICLKCSTLKLKYVQYNENGSGSASLVIHAWIFIRCGSVRNEFVTPCAVSSSAVVLTAALFLFSSWQWTIFHRSHLGSSLLSCGTTRYCSRKHSEGLTMSTSYSIQFSTLPSATPPFLWPLTNISGPTPFFASIFFLQYEHALDPSDSCKIYTNSLCNVAEIAQK